MDRDVALKELLEFDATARWEVRLCAAHVIKLVLIAPLGVESAVVSVKICLQ